MFVGVGLGVYREPVTVGTTEGEPSTSGPVPHWLSLCLGLVRFLTANCAWTGSRLGLAARTWATAPATCAAAADVPANVPFGQYDVLTWSYPVISGLIRPSTVGP